MIAAVLRGSRCKSNAQRVDSPVKVGVQRMVNVGYVVLNAAVRQGRSSAEFQRNLLTNKMQIDRVVGT